MRIGLVAPHVEELGEIADLERGALPGRAYAFVYAVAQLERKAAALARSYEQVYARLLVEATHAEAPTPPQDAAWVPRAADRKNGAPAFADRAAGWRS
jgi:hypothetical protein